MTDVAGAVDDAEARAFAAFVAAEPGFAGTAALDDLRRREFSRLDRLDHVYVDYTGSGLYSESLVRRHAECLLGHVFGNPHSVNPTSRASTEAVEGCRGKVLSFFRADPREYGVVFTSNASQALKLVGEAYPFERGDRFLLTFDNHNSVNGIREFARSHGADTHYVPVFPPDLRGRDDVVEAHLAAGGRRGRRLFAYPAQSNFSGVQHPLEWIDRAHAHGCDVLLDAAAFAPTSRLDLSRAKPEFVTLSFYKMFGFPTGVGALVARYDALARLRRPWFAGGTIDVASVQADQFRYAAGTAAFEDGTPNFLAMPAVEMGLEMLDAVGVEVIHARVRALTSWLLQALQSLAHSNGHPLVRVYGPGGAERRGGTIAFNLAGRDGNLVDHALVDARAAEGRISLRTGCFCNPGAGELAFALSRDEITACLSSGRDRMSYDDFRRCIDPKAAGAVRASLGIVSTFRDAWRLVRLLESFRDA
jgi:selenocysteine lyase/cysteine desulfurase